MPVTVMDVWIVRVRVRKFVMPMRVGMGFTGWIARSVGMPVMLVVSMQMIVFEPFVVMLVLVAFRQMQPDAKAHQNPRDAKSNAWSLAKEHNGDDCADK